MIHGVNIQYFSGVSDDSCLYKYDLHWIKNITRNNVQTVDVKNKVFKKCTVKAGFVLASEAEIQHK